MTDGEMLPSQADIDRAHKFLRGMRRPTINRNVSPGVAVEAMFRWHQQESKREREAINLAGVAHAEVAGEVGVHSSGDGGDSRRVFGSTDGRFDGSNGAETMGLTRPTVPDRDEGYGREAIARIIEPAAWRAYDATLRPFDEHRGAHEGESWHVRAYQAGCRSSEDARRWWFGASDPSEPVQMFLFLESLGKADAIRALADRQPDQRGGDVGERIAEAVLTADTSDPEWRGRLVAALTDTQDASAGMVLVPREPTEAQWGGLARAIIMWLDMSPKTPRALFRHLEASGQELPQWLCDEPEMRALDHVPSKGTRAVLIYRAMIAAAHPAASERGEGA